MKFYIRNSEIHAASLDDEIVLMSTEGNRYFSLNSLGTQIWAFLEQPRTMQEIVGAVESNYEIDEIQARQDVGEFLEVLESRNLIITH